MHLSSIPLKICNSRFNYIHFIKMSSANVISAMKITRNNKSVLEKRNGTRLKLFLTSCYSAILLYFVCVIGRKNNNLGVNAQKVDCTEGYLCDFFSRFPHLPFSKLHAQNQGYIRTLDYMIHKDKDVYPVRHYSTNSIHDDNYYKKELSEIRSAPLYREASSPIFPVFKHSNGRKYEPKVSF